MKISARNILKRKIVDMKNGATTSHASIDIGGAVVTASITNEAVDELGSKSAWRHPTSRSALNRVLPEKWERVFRKEARQSKGREPMRKLLIVIAGCSCLLAGPAYASGEGCSDFLWPLKTELSWMKAAGSETVASGAIIPALPKDKAIELALLPVSEVSLPIKPTSTPKPEDTSTLAGFVVISAIQPGHYQVSISSHAWMDVVQNGKPLEATGHTGAKNCDGLRKSVRFEIGAGPVTLQINNAPKDSIRITVRPAAD